MSATLEDCIFIVTPFLYDKERGYQLAVIWQGHDGFFPVTNRYFGHDWDLAIETVNDMNHESGYDPYFVSRVYEVANHLNEVHFFNT